MSSLGPVRYALAGLRPCNTQYYEVYVTFAPVEALP